MQLWEQFYFTFCSRTHAHMNQPEIEPATFVLLKWPLRRLSSSWLKSIQVGNLHTSKGKSNKADLGRPCFVQPEPVSSWWLPGSSSRQHHFVTTKAVSRCDRDSAQDQPVGLSCVPWTGAGIKKIWWICWHGYGIILQPVGVESLSGREGKRKRQLLLLVYWQVCGNVNTHNAHLHLRACRDPCEKTPERACK